MLDLIKIMKFFVFICALVFVESFTLEHKEEFIGHDAGVEIHNDGDELKTLVRNKRQFSSFQPIGAGGMNLYGGLLPIAPRFPPSGGLNLNLPRSAMPLPSTNYQPMPSLNLPSFIPPTPSPFSGNIFGAGQTLGGKLNYDVPRGGASVMGSHTFGNPSSMRLGVEGRYNIINDKIQKLSVMAAHESNLGPGPKMPSNTVGISYQRSFR